MYSLYLSIYLLLIIKPYMDIYIYIRHPDDGWGSWMDPSPCLVIRPQERTGKWKRKTKKYIVRDMTHWVGWDGKNKNLGQKTKTSSKTVTGWDKDLMNIFFGHLSTEKYPY